MIEIQPVEAMIKAAEKLETGKIFVYNGNRIR